MKIKVCCEEMKDAIIDEFIDIDYDKKSLIITAHNIEILYCPFCGDIIEVDQMKDNCCVLEKIVDFIIKVGEHCMKCEGKK